MPNEAYHIPFLNDLADGDMDGAKSAYDEAILNAEVLDVLSDKSSPFSMHMRLLEAERKPYMLEALHLADQTFATINTPQFINFSTVAFSNGITVTTGDTVNIVYPGDYMVSVIPQMESTGGANRKLSIWMELNGVVVANSLGFATDDNNEGNLICLKQMFMGLVAEDEIKVKAEVNGTSIKLSYTAIAGAKPAGPSVEVVVMEIR